MKKQTKPTGDLPPIPPPPPAPGAADAIALANTHALSYEDADAGLTGTAEELANRLAISYDEAEALLA